MLEFIAELPSSSSFIDASARNGQLITVESGNLRKFSLPDLGQELAVSTILSSPAGICFVAQATAALTQSSGNSIDLVDLNTGARTNVSAGSSSVSATRGQQIAGQVDQQIAFATSGTADKVIKIDASAGTASTMAVNLGTGTSSCVATKDTNWIIGTNNGKVVEANAAGTVIKTITLATTPNNGSTPTLVVSGLSYFNDHLAVLTTGGVGYIYEYSSSTIISRFIVPSNSGGAGPVLCESSSGLTLYGSNYDKGGPQSVTEMQISPTNYLSTYIFNETSAGIVASGFDPSLSLAFIILAGSLRLFRVDSTISTTIEAEILNNNVPVSGRILRLRDYGPGRSQVEVDENISAVATDLYAVEDTGYIEVTIITDGVEKADARRTHS